MTPHDMEGGEDRGPSRDHAPSIGSSRAESGADTAAKTFWVLERDGKYVALTVDGTSDGGFVRIPSWTDDVRDCRHWPTFKHADDARRGLEHPFWMADVIEHAWITDYGDVS